MVNNILVPRLGVNDDYIVIGEWFVKQGDYVKMNQEIAILESSKETSIFLSSYEGYITICVQEHEEAKVGDVLAIITKNIEHASDIFHEQAVDLDVNVSTDERKYTRKAKELIEKNRIDISLLPKNQIITEKDVYKLFEEFKPYTISETQSNVVLIYGRGGFCKMAIDIIEQNNGFRLYGIIEYHYPDTDEIYGVKVVGNDSDLLSYYEKGYTKIINAVMTKNNQYWRKPPYEMLKKIGFECINLIHSKAVIERTVRMGEGNIICAGAMIGADAVIGSNCIINCNAVISHDCIISDSCHVASGAILASGVIVGENTLIGQGCTIYNDVKIGANVVIKNGTHVFSDMTSEML